MLDAARWVRFAGAVAVAGMVGGFLPIAAKATPLSGDNTAFELLDSQLLSANGITADVIPGTGPNPAFVNAIGQAVIPITGGDLDLNFLEGTIAHEPTAGISLTSGAGSLSLTNLVIDLDFFRVTANVSGTGIGPVSDATVFDLTLCVFSAGSDPCVDGGGSTRLYGMGLRLNAGAAPLLGAALGLTDEQLLELSGPFLVLALPDIRTVPEPGTFALVGAGLLGLAARGRRARA